MKAFFLRTCLMLAVALPLAGQSADWKKYDDKAGNFSVLFPGQPQDSVNASDATMQSHTLMVIDKPVVYTVVYTAMVAEQKVDDATYQVFKNAVFKELPKCDVETELPPAPALNGYIGHWYRLTCHMPNAVTVEGNLYWGPHHAYAVMAMFPATSEGPHAEQKFLKSFSLLDPAK